MDIKSIYDITILKNIILNLNTKLEEERKEYKDIYKKLKDANELLLIQIDNLKEENYKLTDIINNTNIEDEENNLII